MSDAFFKDSPAMLAFMRRAKALNLPGAFIPGPGDIIEITGCQNQLIGLGPVLYAQRANAAYSNPLSNLGALFSNARLVE